MKMDVMEKLVELLQDANNPVLRWFQTHWMPLPEPPKGE